MNSETIEAKVKEILLDMLDISEDDITPNASLINDLDASSVDLVEIISEIENEYDVDVSDEEAASLRTVQNVFDYVQKVTG